MASQSATRIAAMALVDFSESCGLARRPIPYAKTIMIGYPAIRTATTDYDSSIRKVRHSGERLPFALENMNPFSLEL